MSRPKSRSEPRTPDAAEQPRCPICEASADRSGDAFPFCSRRCRMVDLDRWFAGRYVVSRPLNDDDLANLG
ncbi:MAG: DNA gyrase inhibitor YacG [Phycisphaerales bacterium]